MSLQLEVKRLSQDVSIEDGKAVTQNYVLFELPNGGVVKAAIDEPAADALLDALVRGAESVKVLRQDQGYEAPSYARPSTRSVPSLGPIPSEDDSVKEFGGEDTTPPAPEKPIARAPVQVVGKDEYGYPIMRGGTDPGGIKGIGSAVDEDGVGQV